MAEKFHVTADVYIADKPNIVTLLFAYCHASLVHAAFETRGHYFAFWGN